MSAPENPPAFPYAFQHEDDSRYITQGFAPGMTLRDWFAGQALAARIIAVGDHTHSSHGERLHCKALNAQRAYEHADAMLKARQAQSPQASTKEGA